MRHFSSRTIIVAAVALIAGVFAYRAAFVKPQPTVQTIEVRRGAVSQEVSETGEVVASDDLNLFFKNVGRVAHVPVREGDIVTVGQTLMQQATGELEAQLRSALSALTSAQAKFAQASAGASMEEVHVAETAVQNAKARVAAAEQAQTDAQAALADTIGSNETAMAKTYGDYKAALETLFVKASAGYYSLKNDALDANERMSFVSVSETQLASARQLIDDFPSVKANYTLLESDLAVLRGLQDRVQIDDRAIVFISHARIIRDSLQRADSILQASTSASTTSQTAYDTRKA
ncbi:MAG: biotin/lipoyl-binding protein, partial [Patescibacteria group bacterium]